MLRTIAYVLTSFPQPSETFIADEALSLIGNNIQPCILYIKDGDHSKVHPSAQALLNSARLLRLNNLPRRKILGALARMFVRAPIRSIRTFISATRNSQRWCYMQALPAAQWCLDNKVEFLHSHFADVNFIYASAISAWTGIPYGITTHRYDILEDPIDKTIAIDLYKSAATIVTISEFNRQYMSHKYGIPISRIQVIHCGIDLNRFTFSEREPQQNGKVFRILNVGRLFPEKAQEVLLMAMSILRTRKVPFALEIIGAGPRKDELMQLATAQNLTDSVVFHGAQTAEFVKERLAAADLFVLSSRAEGLPVVCIEALAVGTPVIATQIYGIPELIEDGVNGLLVPPDDPLALAEAIYKAYKNPSLIQHMPNAGRRTVETNFERGKCTEQLIREWNTSILRTT